MIYPKDPSVRQWKSLTKIVLGNGDITSKMVLELGPRVAKATVSRWKAEGKRELDELTVSAKVVVVEKAKEDWTTWMRMYGTEQVQQLHADNIQVFEETVEPVEGNSEVVPMGNCNYAEITAVDGSVNCGVVNGYKLLEQLRSERIASYTNELSQLQEVIAEDQGKLAQEYKQVSAAISKCMTLMRECVDPKELTSLCSTLDRLIKLRKGLTGSVFGAIAIDSKTSKAAATGSKHVHFHNAGIPGFKG